MVTSSVSKSIFPKKSAFPKELQLLSNACTRVHDLESQGLYSNPVQYYDFLQNRVMIIFKPKFEDHDQDQPEFKLILSKKQNYDIVSR
jgi:hypothetical protein